MRPRSAAVPTTALAAHVTGTRSVRTVLVTGAASGIGEACARRLARSGWRVLAGVRREADAERLRSERIEPVVLDVTGPVEVDVDVLHALVNNAGVALALPLELLPLEELRRQLEVNLVGQLRVTQALLPELRRARGRIVFVGSIAGRSALPFLGGYAASKFALEALADSLRVEVAPFGVRVAVVEPGSIATPIWTKGAARSDELLATLPGETVALYADALAAFRAVAAARASRRVPAEDVAAAVERALTVRRPRSRYVVGRDARLRARLERLPTPVRDRLIAHALLRGGEAWTA